MNQNRIEQITRSYRRFIMDRYNKITCLDRDVSLTMENYIPLQLGEVKREERPAERRRSESERLQGGYVDFRVWREEHLVQASYSLTPVDLWMALRNKRVVVKGDPGSGKTTLTSYIAYSLCSQTDSGRDGAEEPAATGAIPKGMIPLVIDLKDWAGTISNEPLISLPKYYARCALKGSGLEKEIEPLIENWLTSSKCIILCDGLDEITQDRDPLIRSLQNLASGVYGDCHILVTTRIVGYGNELSGWKHYEVMPLRDEHIRQYAEEYLTKDKSSSFLSALKHTPQMEPLSKNPLLLQILCFVFDKQRSVLPAPPG